MGTSQLAPTAPLFHPSNARPNVPTLHLHLPQDDAASLSRWSEVVPPDTALTFHVVWDASDSDIIAFSGAQLLDSPPPRKSLDSPSEIIDTDGQSQVLTIRPPSSYIPYSENTATMAFFRENADILFKGSTPTPLDFPDIEHRPLNRRRTREMRRTQTSSTLDGLDVYLRGSLLAKAHHNYRYYSCLSGLDGDFDFDPLTSFAKAWGDQHDAMRKDGVDSVDDEGFFEMDRTANVTSPQSHTDPAGKKDSAKEHPLSSGVISEFISIANDNSGSWSALERPNTPTFLSCSQSRLTRKPSNRLRKRRQPVNPDVVPPHIVLQRPDYSYNTSPSSLKTCSSPTIRSASLPSRTKIPRLFKWKRESVYEPWVCVEIVTPRQPYATS